MPDGGDRFGERAYRNARIFPHVCGRPLNVADVCPGCWTSSRPLTVTDLPPSYIGDRVVPTSTVPGAADPHPDCVPITPTVPVGDFFLHVNPEDMPDRPEEGWWWISVTQPEESHSPREEVILENMLVMLDDLWQEASALCERTKPRALRWTIQGLSWTFGSVILALIFVGILGVGLASIVLKGLSWAEDQE